MTVREAGHPEVRVSDKCTPNPRTPLVCIAPFTHFTQHTLPLTHSLTHHSVRLEDSRVHLSSTFLSHFISKFTQNRPIQCAAAPSPVSSARAASSVSVCVCFTCSAASHEVGVVLVFVVLFSCQVLHVLLHSGCDFPGKSRHGSDLVCGLSE